MTRTISNPEVGRYYNVSQRIEITDCPTCGIAFGVPKRLIERAREENAAVGKALVLYCPLGHTIHWTGRNEEQELNRKLEIQRNRAGRLAHERDQVEASRNAHKAAATRARNERDRIGRRIKGGVCPCCGQTFKGLARHMQSQHPDFDPGAEG